MLHYSGHLRYLPTAKINSASRGSLGNAGMTPKLYHCGTHKTTQKGMFVAKKNL